MHSSHFLVRNWQSIFKLYFIMLIAIYIFISRHFKTRSNFKKYIMESLYNNYFLSKTERKLKKKVLFCEIQSKETSRGSLDIAVRSI